MSASTAWTVLSPEGRRAYHPSEEPLPVPGSPQTIAYLSNHKPNARELQVEVAAMLEEAGISARSVFYEKPTMAVGAAASVLDEISQTADFVVNGVGD